MKRRSILPKEGNGMTKSWTLLIAAAIAGLGHSVAPDHWLTYVLTAKAKNLSRFRAMFDLYGD
jgi:hypothetical protein